MRAPSGKRFRTRPVDEIADEIAWLRKHRGIDIFTFHDDNFFAPGHRPSLERINRLADALDARGIGRIGTVIKARPTDITPEVVQVVRNRLGCIRAYIGIETNAEQGLKTLTRRVRRDENNEAIRLMCEAGVYVCYNLLLFDPDTKTDDLEANLAFAETHAETPMNFGRVELYAGTPLLARMLEEGRCTDDYLGWDYRLADPRMHRIFKLATQCFFPRNLAAGALAHSLQGTRFQVEVCRHFHSDVFETAWLTQAKELSKRLTLDSVSGLREIITFSQEEGASDQRNFVHDLSWRLRQAQAPTSNPPRKSPPHARATLSGKTNESSGDSRAVFPAHPVIARPANTAAEYPKRTIRMFFLPCSSQLSLNNRRIRIYALFMAVRPQTS